jgi:hypothetical protein
MSFDHRLREHFLSAERGIPQTSIDWEETISRGKRERMYRMTMVAAAAILFIGGGAWSARGLFTSDPAPLPAPAATITDDPTPEESPSRNIEQGSDASLVRGRVLDWVKALSIGDAQGAWSMMSFPSREYYGGSVEAFERDFLPELAEGWGSWYEADQVPETDVHTQVSSGDGSVGVVTVYGEVRKEGTRAYDADSVAFRIIDGEAFIEPYSSKVEIGQIEPTFEEQYVLGSLPSEFRAEVPSDLTQVNFYLQGVPSDGRSATIEEMEQEGSQPPNSIASSPVPEGLEPGSHFLTISAVDGNGELSITVVPFGIVEQ